MAENNFDTKEMVQEIENIIKSNLKKILSKFMDRYDLLEETHKQIMNLPSVMNELKEFSKNNEDTKSEINMNHFNKCITDLNDKICNIEKRIDIINPILGKILLKINDLNI